MKINGICSKIPNLEKDKEMESKRVSGSFRGNIVTFQHQKTNYFPSSYRSVHQRVEREKVVMEEGLFGNVVGKKEEKICILREIVKEVMLVLW